MHEKSNAPLQVAVHGMDARSLKMMMMFLQGPCKGSAVVVPDDVANVDIIDADAKDAKVILQQRKQLYPDRPVIALSLQIIDLEGVIFMQKPVQTTRMLAVLKEARQIIVNKQKKDKRNQKFIASKEIVVEEQKAKISKTHAPVSKPEPKPAKKVFVNTDEQKKTSKHQTAMQLDESGFSAFIGLASGVDYSDPAQLKTASYNAKQYYQGYVQSAFKLAISKKRSLQLNSGWKPLAIFPMTHEIWVDADDKQLRSFSAVPITQLASSGSDGVTVTVLDPKKVNAASDLKKFQSMDAFVWKLAIWTSKGRYPQSIDIDKPVYLKRWPNFTRLMISPHSLRIAALLIEGPRTLLDVAHVLNIKPQYVFAFFSAAYASGIAGQAERKADVLVAPETPKVSKKKGILSNIMRKLRGK